jgi:HK97 family phage major capsid protein
VPYAGLTGNWVRAISATTLLGRIPYALVPFNTKTIVDGSGASGGWVAEGAVIPMARGSLSVTPMLGMKSVKAIFAVTDELLTSTAPANLANLEEIAARSVRFTMDRSMLDPSMAATAAQPASLTNGITPLASTGSTAAAVMSDLRALLQAVLDGGSPDFSSTVFVMSPTDALALSLLLTSGGQRAFPDLGATGGSIWGVPALVSKAADLGGSPPARIIAAIDGSRVLVADDGLMTVGASKAALQFTDAPVAGAANSISLYQTESTAIRLVLYKNFTRATAGCVAWMSVSY